MNKDFIPVQYALRKHLAYFELTSRIIMRFPFLAPHAHHTGDQQLLFS